MALQKTAGNSSPLFIDDKLAKAVDGNGEPLVDTQKAMESYNVIRKLADAVFAKTKAIF